MNKRIITVFALFALCISMVFVYTSCDIKNPTEGLAVIVSTIERQTLIGVNISDPNGINVTSKLNVQFTGKDADKVIDEVNNKMTAVATSNGNFVFAIKDGTVITESAPVKLVLQIRSANKDYLDVDYPVTLTKTGNLTFNVKMVKTSAASSAGVDQSKTNNAGTTDQTGKVTTPVSVTTTSGTTVTIPQGTVLKDNSGNPLTGNLSVSMTTYTPQASTLLPTSTIKVNNQSYSSVMGFSMQVTDQTGKVASSVGGSNSGVLVPMNNATNPSTNQSFKAGDKLDIIYMDENGSPQVAGQATVQAKSSPALRKIAPENFYKTAADNLYLVVNILFRAGVLYNFSVSYTPSPVSFDFGENWLQSRVLLELVLSRASDNKVTDTWTIWSRNLQVDLKSGNDKAVVKIAGSPIEVSPKLENISTTSLNSMPVSFQGLTYYDIFVQGKCPNETPTNPKRINPNIYISITRNDGVSFGWIQLSDGRGGTYLTDGTYTVSATYKGVSYSATAVVSNGSVNIRSEGNVQARTDTPANTQGTVHLWYYIITEEACN